MATTKKAAAPAKAVKVDLPAEIFDAEVNIPLIHQVVVAQQAAARQGTHATKRRGDVRGGGRKPYKQKGTGRARQGSTRAPQFAGGGVVHGPQPRSYAQRTPKKMIAAALRGALSDRARDGRIHVVDSLVSGDKPSTKAALAALTGLVADRANFLLVLERSDALTWLSLRNAPAGAHRGRRPGQHLRRAGQPTTSSSPGAPTTRSSVAPPPRAPPAATRSRRRERLPRRPTTPTQGRTKTPPRPRRPTRPRSRPTTRRRPSCRRARRPR